MNKKLRNSLSKKNINKVVLTGEVVDLGVSPLRRGLSARARIKVCPTDNGNDCFYIDVFGRRECADTMTLICQNGNIVYVEGEFRSNKNAGMNQPYIMVTYIECLLRRKSVNAPKSEKIIALLDNLDPIGYVRQEKPKKTRKNTRAPVEE